MSSEQEQLVGDYMRNMLVLRVQDTLREIAEHDHANAPLSDIHCLNLKAWLGDQMPAVLDLLREAQVEVDRLRERETALADHALALIDEREDRIEAKLDRILAFTDEARGIFALYVRLGTNKLVSKLTRRTGREQ